MEECDQINVKFLKGFELFILSLTTSFLEVTVLVSLKVATICHFRSKKPSKFNIFNAIFKAKTEKYDQNYLCSSHLKFPYIV